MTNLGNEQSSQRLGEVLLLAILVKKYGLPLQGLWYLTEQCQSQTKIKPHGEGGARQCTIWESLCGPSVSLSEGKHFYNHLLTYINSASR